jgi:hypothetical protein
MKLLRRFLLSIFFLLPSMLLAQTGSIAGVVTDSTGAVVPGAQVTATHTGTGATRAIQSSDSGSYSIPNLTVGTYSVSFEKSGFKPMKFDGVIVSVAQVVPLNAQFQLGAVQETVTVTTETQAPIETESSQISNLVDERRIVDLPLLTRNPYDLLLLSPGTSTTNALGGYTVNGSRERNNNFLLDGVDNNDTSVPGGTGSIVLTSNPESTQEFRVITNAFNAEYGRNTGAIVDVVTKSGTNQFHFDAYWFGRYNGMGGARDWFNRAEDPVLPRQNPYVRNQFGYSVGGPIIKNKTFFFFNNEFQRFRTSLTIPATVPTAQFKNTGKFDWQTTTVNPDTGHATPVTIPVDLTETSPQGIGVGLDPTVEQILALFPDPTRLNADGYTGQIFFPSASKQDSYQTVFKLDHRFTDRHVLSARYGYNHFVDPNSGQADILPGNIAAVGQKALSQAAAASLSSTLSNNLVNVFNFGWNHIYSTFNCQRLDILNSVSPLDQFGYGRDYLMSPFTSFGCTALVADGQFRKTGTTSYGDDLTWARGNHTLKLGADFRNIGESGPNSFFSRRQVDLRSSTTFGANFLTIASPVHGEVINPGDFGALADAASAYWGFVVSDFNGQFFNIDGARQPVDEKKFRQHEYSFFAQDAWKVRRNLTLNLGLRYQFNGVPFEENANFSNLLTDPSSFPVVFSRVGPGTGKQIYNNDYSNIEPRVGFSWDPWGDGKTAIRGAVGLFHDRVFGNLFGNARGNPPFEQDYQDFPFETINDAFGSGKFPAIAPTQEPSATVPDGAGLAPIVFDTHFRNSSSANWNFGIQREIGANFVIDVNYVASKGTHIYRQVDGTPPDPALVQQLLDFCVPTNEDNADLQCTEATVTKANLWFGKEAGALPFNAVEHNALFQPFYIRSIGNSNYNALQAKVTRRFSRGFQVQGSYTYAHAIDDSGDPLAPAAGNRGFPRNTRKIFQERGNSDNDVRHIGVINYIWELPLGAGKAHWNQGFVGKVFEGFQVSGITSLQTGHPFDVFSTRDSEHSGLSNRADLTGDPYAVQDRFPDSGNRRYLNADAFDTPPFGRAGNIGRNRLYGPSYVNFDMSVAKKMKLTERFGLETRFEAFNVFNHPQFNNPGSDANAFGNLIGSSIFGDIVSTQTRPDGTTSARQMQVAMKLTF